MANNRLFIVCRKCNAFTTIMKFYPPGGFIGGEQGWYFPFDQVPESKDEWIQEHEKHAKNLDLNGGEYFSFVTEGDNRVRSIDFTNNKIAFI